MCTIKAWNNPTRHTGQIRYRLSPHPFIIVCTWEIPYMYTMYLCFFEIKSEHNVSDEGLQVHVHMDVENWKWHRY